MLNPNSLADVAANTRDRSGMGASITRGGEAVVRNRALAMSAACPQPSTAAVHCGSGTTEPSQVEFTWLQRATRKYTHTTRIAAADGGALGSHPARDPV